MDNATLERGAPWDSPVLDRSLPIGIVLRAKVADMIARVALRAAPKEMCGVLTALPGDGRVRFWEMGNVARVPEHRFTFAPEPYREMLQHCAATGEELLAIVHSHPNGPAEPSAQDIANARDATLHYLIVELNYTDQYRTVSLTSWRIRDGVATREQVQFV